LNAQRVSFFGGLLAFENLFFPPLRHDDEAGCLHCVRGGERETKSSNKIRGGSNGAVNYGTQEEATVPIFLLLSKLVFHHLLAANRG
jgi:hypothetical protein